MFWRPRRASFQENGNRLTAGELPLKYYVGIKEEADLLWKENRLSREKLSYYLGRADIG